MVSKNESHGHPATARNEDMAPVVLPAEHLKKRGCRAPKSPCTLSVTSRTDGVESLVAATDRAGDVAPT